MKTSAETRARMAFLIFLLCVAAGWAAWHLWASRQYVTYAMRTADSVSGLIVDAPVEFHGVDVGTVQRIDLTGPRSVTIQLSIRKTAPVTAATVATLTTRGLSTRGFTGYVYVSLEDVGTDSRPVVAPPGYPFPVIASAPSRTFDLDISMSQMNENIRSVTRLLDSILDRPTITSLKQSLDGLHKITAALAANIGKLDAVIGNGERASRRLSPLLKAANDGLDNLQRRVLPQLNQTASHLDQVSGTLQIQVLPEAYKALGDLDGVAGALRDMTTKINRDPSVLIRGSAPAPGPAEPAR